MRIRSALTHAGLAVLEGLLIAVLSVGLIAGTALAGKPSSGSGGTLSSSCNPCALGTTATFQGSGLDGSNPRAMVAVTDGSGSTAWAGINVNPDGTTTFVWYMTPAGTYTFKLVQERHNRMLLKAQLSGVVVR